MKIIGFIKVIGCSFYSFSLGYWLLVIPYSIQNVSPLRGLNDISFFNATNMSPLRGLISLLVNSFHIHNSLLSFLLGYWLFLLFLSTWLLIIGYSLFN